MKHLISLLFLALLIADSSAQKPIKWKPLKGPNTSSSSNQLLVGANGEIISVGKFGYYSTENDGASWEYHQIIFHVNCSNLTSLNSGLLIASNNEYFFYFGSFSCGNTDNEISGVYRSTDQGITWKQILQNTSVLSIVQSNNNAFFVSTHDSNPYSIYESIDDGNSWTEILKDGTAANIIAVTDKYIYFSGYNGTGCFLFSLLDKTWNTLGNGNSSKFIVLNDDQILLSSNSIIYQSDGTSALVPIGNLTGVKTLVKGEGGKVNAVVNTDNSLFIASSGDNGKNWSTIGKVTPYKQGNQYFLNCERLNTLLYENDTATYLSRDQGNSWKEIGLPFDSINSVIVSDDGRIFAKPVDRNDPSSSTRIYDAQISSDRGESWHKTESAKMKINKISRGINGSIIAVANTLNKYTSNIWLYDSTLPGEWKKVSVIENVTAVPMIATDGLKSVYLATNNYYSIPVIYRSDDNGFSWVDVEAPNTANNIYSLDVSTDGVVYFGSYPVMYRSEDKGASWTKLLPVHEIVKLSYIKTVGTDGVLLGTEGAGLFVSSDKGNSWSRFDGKNFDTVTCIGVDSKGDIIAGTNRGLWLYDPIPKSWTKVMLGDEGNLKIGAIDIASNNDIYVGTYGSSVWVGSRNYNTINYYSPVSHSSMQLSPNPTTGRVAITLEGVNEEEVRLELYDILGRKISTILDGKYSGEIYYNTSSLPNGIYTLMLSGGQNKDEKKLIVQH